LKTALEATYQIKVEVISADLSVEDECHRLFEAAAPFHPEIVVNNAGFGIIGPFLESKLDDELKMIRLNIVGLHILTKLFVQTMTQGVILNVASMAGFLPTPFMAAYAASKAYVDSLSVALNYELKQTHSKVRVLSLCPGPVETNFSNVAGAGPGMKGLSATRVAKIAVRGILKKKMRIIPGFLMGLTKFFLRFLPLGLILPVASALQRKKR
jgi:hypothetical protein